MKKTLRFVALAGVLCLSFLSLQQAEAGPLGPPIPDGCAEGRPCVRDQDCGYLPGDRLAGICLHASHTCYCN